MDDTIHDPVAPEADPAAEIKADAARPRRTHSEAAVLSLRQAMRRARFEDAERSGAVSDLRAARIGRLEGLHEALGPLLTQIPADVDCFDVGIMPGSNPRLFIDMIGFVEMGRDPRVYHFIQDTRHGRIKLAESEDVAAIVEAVTHYVARRLLERDKALAADASDTEAGPPVVAPVMVARPPPLCFLVAGFAFVIDVLGSIAFFSLLAFAAWTWWSRLKP